MGSVVSFPVLCIIVATVCRVSREKDLKRKLSLSHAKIAVNGDDNILRASNLETWTKVAAVPGLKASVGKTFFSKEFLNMNSAQMVVDKNLMETCSTLGKDGLHNWLRLVPAINMGLLVGLGRTTSGKIEKSRIANYGTLNSVSRNAHTLVSECAPEDKERVFKAFINHNWDMLNGTEVRVQLSWFLPEHLGGLGLPTFPDYVVMKDGKETRPWMPTEFDLRLAAAFHKHGKLPPKIPEGVSWKVWEYAQKRMKDFKFGLNESSIISVSNPFGLKGDLDTRLSTETQIMGRLCVEAMFTQNIQDIFVDERQTKNKTIRKIEAAIKAVHKFMGTVEPFDANALPLEPPVIPDRVALKLTTLSYVTDSKMSTFVDHLHFTEEEDGALRPSSCKNQSENDDYWL